jgi:hypothetical protein
MCGDQYSTGIDQTTLSFAHSVVTLAHELGHNFGMSHDNTEDSSCAAGFIMDAAPPDSLTLSWSTCSVAAFNDMEDQGYVLVLAS